MGGRQAGLFDETPPLSHRGDPETSHEAEQTLRSSGRLGELQRLVLNAVREWPGRTAEQLTELTSSEDPRTVPRRLSDLKARGLIEAYGHDLTKANRRAVCWWPHGEVGGS